MVKKFLFFCYSTLFLLMISHAGNAATLQEKVLFHLSFDEGFTADIAKGEAKQFGGEAVLTEGIKGKGAYFTEKQNLHYRMVDNIDLDKGTVEMWVKPVDWSGDTDKNSKTFFVAYGLGWMSGMYHLFFHQGWEVIFGVHEAAEGKQMPGIEVRVPPAIFMDGIWTHLAVTWDNTKGMQFYVNGELKSENAKIWQSFSGYAKRDSALLVFGNRTPWEPDSPCDSIIDEIYIYSGVLNADEVKICYLRDKK